MTDLRFTVDEDGDIEVKAHDEIVCDFCSSTPVTYSFGALNFPAETSSIEVWSRGDWAACDACARLVQGEHRQALAERSVLTFLEASPEMKDHREDLLTAITKTHERFWLARQPSNDRKETS